jgi:ABC-type uncharacterized transport system permease subunit
MDYLAGAIEDVLELEVGLVDGAEATGTFRLVADGKVKVTLLVDAILANRAVDVVELVVLGRPAMRLAQTRSNVVHRVGGAEWKFAVVENITTLRGGWRKPGRQ